MRVFISWSGDKSKKVALILRKWLPNVIQSLEPWMSKSDIGAGSRWSDAISKALDETNFGIICLAKGNLDSPWLNFEAGAIAKRLDRSFVVPYLIDLEPGEIPAGPLNEFQWKDASKEGTFDILASINNQLEATKLADEKLKSAFDKWWPDLEKELIDIPDEIQEEIPKRSRDDKIDEILEIARDLKRGLRKASDAAEAPWQLPFHKRGLQNALTRPASGEDMSTLADLALTRPASSEGVSALTDRNLGLSRRPVAPKSSKEYEE